MRALGRRLIAAALLLALAGAGCGPDYTIGWVKVREHDRVVVWPDLPEALADMQVAGVAPEATWDVRLHLFPAGSWRLGPHNACKYSREHVLIMARVTGDRVAAGCLAHEFAHRWVHVTDGWSAAAKHDDLWAARKAVLDDIVADTWANR